MPAWRQRFPCSSNDAAARREEVALQIIDREALVAVLEHVGGHLDRECDYTQLGCGPSILFNVVT